MKQYIETFLGPDAIIEYTAVAKTESNGKIMWADEEDMLAEVENKIHRVYFLIPNGEKDAFRKVEVPIGVLQQVLEVAKEIQSQKLEPTFWE